MEDIIRSDEPWRNGEQVDENGTGQSGGAASATNEDLFEPDGADDNDVGSAENATGKDQKDKNRKRVVEQFLDDQAAEEEDEEEDGAHKPKKQKTSAGNDEDEEDDDDEEDDEDEDGDEEEEEEEDDDSDSDDSEEGGKKRKRLKKRSSALQLDEDDYQLLQESAQENQAEDLPRRGEPAAVADDQDKADHAADDTAADSGPLHANDVSSNHASRATICDTLKNLMKNECCSTLMTIL